MTHGGYTHTRIKKNYLEKLRMLASRHNRSCMKELEALIDESYGKDYNAFREHQRNAAKARISKMTPAELSERNRQAALKRWRKG